MSSTTDNQASCRDEHDPVAVTVEQARENILATVDPVAGTQLLPLRNALHRVTAGDVHARLDVPPSTNSAMDGFALRHASLDRSTDLKIIGTAFAGIPYDGSVGEGETVRIMTGAVLPDGTDTVVMQEDVAVEQDIARCTAYLPQRGENVRHPGDDLKRGALIFAGGKPLQAADLGLLASQGFAQVQVRRRVRVAFFSTGDELVSVGNELGIGQIYDSNRYTLLGLLRDLGVDALDLGVVRDQPDAVRSVFSRAAASADIVISTGGVSVGEADYIKPVLEEQGSVAFWKIAMRPGRPLTFGRLGDALFFGLPGNPVSVAVTFSLFVAPAVKRMSGIETGLPLKLRVRCLSDLSKAPGRRDFQRGRLHYATDGELVVETTGSQGSHVLSSMSEANCYIVLAEDSRGASRGEQVEVLPFHTDLRA